MLGKITKINSVVLTTSIGIQSIGFFLEDKVVVFKIKTDKDIPPVEKNKLTLFEIYMPFFPSPFEMFGLPTYIDKNEIHCLWIKTIKKTDSKSGNLESLVRIAANLTGKKEEDIIYELSSFYNKDKFIHGKRSIQLLSSAQRQIVTKKIRKYIDDFIKKQNERRD